MFFSARELHAYAASADYWQNRHFNDLLGRGYVNRPITLSDCARIMRRARAEIVERDEDSAFTGKWLRPWHVVPELRTFRPPAGDYGVGVEIEMGFRTQEDASFIADKIKNWKYVAIDWEGGDWGMEVTFAPKLYSKMTADSQAFRYLKLLEENRDRLVNHDPEWSVGTHVNVSAPLGVRIGYDACDELSDVLENDLTREENVKYFGRMPYGYANDMGGYIEYKLFNSVTDWKTLRRYIDIAVSLTALVASREDITRESVIAALEAGYNKH